MRDNGQSSLLVDGRFLQEDELTVEKLDVNAADAALPGGEEAGALTERWKITIPDDGVSTHQIRYQAPQGQTDGVEIYVYDGAAWTKAETELMGIYHLFSVDGSSVEIGVCVTGQGIMDDIFFVAAGAAAVTALAVLLVHKKRKKRLAQKAEKDGEGESGTETAEKTKE